LHETGTEGKEETEEKEKKNRKKTVTSGSALDLLVSDNGTLHPRNLIK
jgi:hypothetical protein